DCLRVLPGERIAMDGRVLSGAGAVDEQLLTGESMPVTKEPGHLVFAGTSNLDGELKIVVTATAREGTVARLVALVRRACSVKGRHQRAADLVSAWFTPVVTLLALGTAVYQARRLGVELGILSGLSVLVIACPCALGLAMPMALWAGLGRAAR